MCSEIYAIGLRNPFRLAMDSNTKDKVRFYVGDVGGKQWEEISEGGTDHMGVNYGWEVREGPCKRDTDIDCDPVVEYDDPIYWYAHRRFTSGGAVTGGSFVPNGVWPKEYDNTYIFVDYTYGEMYHLIDGGEDCRTCSPPTPKFTNATFHSAPSVVDMFFGPYEDTQALYYLSSFDDALRRIIYTGTTNRSPVPVLAVNTSAVLPGDLIQFDASESSDPDDGDSLSYLWTFGDGLTTTDVSPIHSYSELGQYQVELAVEDLSGLRSRAFYIVVVGLPPNVQMNIPVIGATFAVGDRLTLSGQVWYVNGGGDTVQLSELHWEVQQHHAQHFHPFLAPTEGNDFMIDPAPPPEDNVAASNSFLRVVLTGYNEDGLSTSVMRDIMPRLSYLDIASEPSGLQVSVDGSLVTTPANVMSWENHKLHVGIKDQGVNVFREWSSGENREHIVTLSPRNTQIPKITAYFESWIESVAPSIAPSDRLVPPTNLAQQLDEAIPLVAPSIAPSDRFVPSTNSAHQLDEAMPLVAPSIAPSLRFVPSTNSAQQLDEAIPVVTPIKKSCSEKYTCGRCEGHCFVDADCKGGLVCFQKDEGLPRVDSVPGCIGAGTSRTNWCTRLVAIEEALSFSLPDNSSSNHRTLFAIFPIVCLLSLGLVIF
jgi:PKD repeat protein